MWFRTCPYIKPKQSTVYKRKSAKMAKKKRDSYAFKTARN